MTSAQSAKDIASIPLYKDGALVGSLDRTPDGCRISYAKAVETLETGASDQGIRWKSLTFRIPWAASPLEFRGINLPPYFVGLLPEGLRMRALAKRLKTSEDDYYSLLLAAGTDPIGSIHFAADQVRTDEQIKNFRELDFKEVKSDLLKGIVLGEPIAGVQEKISASRLSLQLNGARECFILKIGSTEFPDLVENEFACLALAEKCEIPVNRAKIVQDRHGLSALVVNRFDRIWDENTTTWRRFHLEDACQFLNLYPADKYRVSLQAIAKEIAALSYTPEIEILALLKLYAFCYLVGNGDLHAKNISLIQESPDSNITLSMAYDLVCTAMYGDLRMALKLDGKDTNLRRRDFVSFGTRFGVPESLTREMLDTLIDLFCEHVGGMFSVPYASQEKSDFLMRFWAERVQDLS